MYRKFGKVFFDYALAIFGLVLALPIMATTSIGLLLTGHPSVFFMQKRAGLNGKNFWLLKFRSMTDECDDTGVLLHDELRLTRLGKFLRKTSIDEIPQLINVLKGDMSLIGPRPLFPEYTELFSDDHLKRLEVKPGITGWAQVNGRNATSWQRRLDFDVEYVQQSSPSFDLLILIKTVLTVLSVNEVKATNSTIMPKFRGYQQVGKHS